MLRNIGNIPMRRHYTSAVVRLAARTLDAIRKITGDEKLSYFEALRPDMYNIFVQAVFQVCGPESTGNIEELASPSNAIKLSYDLQRLAEFKMQNAMELKDEVDSEKYRKEAKYFLKRLSLSWGVDVKKQARHVLSIRQMNTVTELPEPGNFVYYFKIFFICY